MAAVPTTDHRCHFFLSGSSIDRIDINPHASCYVPDMILTPVGNYPPLSPIVHRLVWDFELARGLAYVPAAYHANHRSILHPDSPNLLDFVIRT
jgi:hypothetical protein